MFKDQQHTKKWVKRKRMTGRLAPDYTQQRIHGEKWRWGNQQAFEKEDAWIMPYDLFKHVGYDRVIKII